MLSLLAWYALGVVVFAVVAVLLPAGDAPVLSRSVAVLGIAVLWPVVLIGVTEWFLIRTVARAFAEWTRPAKAPAESPILAVRR